MCSAPAKLPPSVRRTDSQAGRSRRRCRCSPAHRIIGFKSSGMDRSFVRRLTVSVRRLRPSTCQVLVTDLAIGTTSASVGLQGWSEIPDDFCGALVADVRLERTLTCPQDSYCRPLPELALRPDGADPHLVEHP